MSQPLTLRTLHLGSLYHIAVAGYFATFLLIWFSYTKHALEHLGWLMAWLPHARPVEQLT